VLAKLWGLRSKIRLSVYRKQEIIIIKFDLSVNLEVPMVLIINNLKTTLEINRKRQTKIVLEDC
jgi:hypothetical protein